MSGFDIRAYLEERKALIDRALERHFQELSQPRILCEAMRYGVFSGGKRLRPVLMLAAGELFGAGHEALLPFACGLELIHTYSIVHDDLPALDDDDVRRGMPASHKIYGEGMALLAGDALLTEAFRLMTRPDAVRSLEPGSVLELIQEITHAAGASGMVGGQALDLESEGREADLATVESIHARKTAAIILAAIRVGAKIGGAKPQDLERVSRYGEFLGLAFQIADDIADTEDEGRGKRKKATYPSVVGLEAARARACELLDRALEELKPFGAAAEPLRGIALYIGEQVKRYGKAS